MHGKKYEDLKNSELRTLLDEYVIENRYPHRVGGYKRKTMIESFERLYFSEVELKGFFNDRYT